MAIFVIKGAVLSYPVLFTPKLPKNARPGQNPRYSCTLLIPIDLDITEVQQATYAMMKEKWGERLDELLQAPPPGNLKWPFRKDNKKLDGTKRFDETRFKCFIPAWSETAPGLVDRYAGPDGKAMRILSPNTNKFYAGCYVNASVNPFVFDQSGNRGASMGLQNLQMWADGERLDNRADGSEFQVESRPAVDLAQHNAEQGAAAPLPGDAAGPGSRGRVLNNLFT